MTNSRTNEVMIPPSRGAAMRFITSAPVPVESMIGTSPQIIVATVITFGRSRRTAPSMIASRRSAAEFSRFSRCA